MQRQISVHIIVQQKFDLVLEFEVIEITRFNKIIIYFVLAETFKCLHFYVIGSKMAELIA